jgi:Dihaem cytochrome c
MSHQQKRRKISLNLAVAMIWIAGTVVLSLQGCQSNPAKTSDSSDSAPAPKVLGIFPPPPEQAGAQLWADNCNRCHNAPPPERFSDAQWDVIVHHMRVRANLTGEEQRKITEFLQASN